MLLPASRARNYSSTFYKTYYKLPVSMFTSVKRQPVVIYESVALTLIKNKKMFFFPLILLYSASCHLSYFMH